MEPQLAELELQRMGCFKAFEDNGLNSTNVGRLWEVAQRFSEVDESFNFQECAHQECMLTGDEPEVEACIPEDMPEEHNTMQVAPPFEQHSPEHMAQWMIGGSWKCSQGEGLRGMQTNHGLSEQNLPKRSSAKAKRLEHDE